MAQDRSTVSRFGSAFAWLLAREVPAERIAALFATKAGTVRVAAHRWRKAGAVQSGDWPTITVVPTERERKHIGIRQGFDEVVGTSRRRISLESLEARIVNIVERHRADYQFSVALRELCSLLPSIGYPADLRRIHLAALLHQHMAWFLVHSGRCRSAMEQARVARDLWRSAYNESPQRLYADEYVRSALIASHAALLNRQPEEALGILSLATECATQSGAPIGSDHYRQRGVACFQMRQDEQARSFFEKSTVAMDRLNEAQTPVSLLMTGSRHTNLLGVPDWDSAQELVSLAKADFGAESLEHSMCLHWAAACAFSSDSTAVKTTAMEMLQRRTAPAPHLGHQLTIAKLLSITPELGFDDRLQKAWVRRALYENTVRDC